MEHSTQCGSTFPQVTDLPTAGHAVEPARAGQGATAGRQGIALQAPATARTGTGQAGALLQPGIPYLPTVSPAGQRSR
jgi:hypothetical protein